MLSSEWVWRASFASLCLADIWNQQTTVCIPETGGSSANCSREGRKKKAQTRAQISLEGMFTQCQTPPLERSQSLKRLNVLLSDLENVKQWGREAQWIGRSRRYAHIAPVFSSKEVQPQTNWTQDSHLCSPHNLPEGKSCEKKMLQPGYSVVAGTERQLFCGWTAESWGA